MNLRDAQGSLEQDIALAVALHDGDVRIEWIEELVRASGADPVRAIDAHELIATDGACVALAPGVEAETIAGAQSAVAHRALHLRLADAIGAAQTERVISAQARGFHLARGGRRYDAIDEYLTAADAAARAGRVHDEQRSLTAALELEDRPELRVPLLQRVALTLVHIGELASQELWAELARAAERTNAHDEHACALFHQFLVSDCAELELLERASSLPHARSGWATLAAGMLVDFDGDLQRAAETMQLAHERAGDDRLLRATSSMALATIRCDLGDGAGGLELIREALEGFRELRLHGKVVTAWYTMVELLLEQAQLSLALAEARSLDAAVEELAIDRFRPLTLSCLAMCHASAGNLDVALDLVSEARTRSEWLRDNPYFGVQSRTYVQMTEAAVLGRVDVARAMDAAGRALRTAQELDQFVWELEARRELLHARARRDGVESALEELTDLDTLPHAAYVATSVHWLARLSVLTDCSAGIERVRTLRADAARWAMTEYAVLVRDEVDALLTAVDTGDVDGLDAVSAEWERRGFHADSIRVVACMGAALARRGEARATEVLRTAKAGLSACGASADADLVAGLLRGLGAASRARPTRGTLGPLTAREVEVARLVASGMRNKDVAQVLSLGERTIAVHLSNIYAKVDLRSRVELAQWMGANDPVTASK